MNSNNSKSAPTSRPNLRHHHRIPADLELHLEIHGETLPPAASATFHDPASWCPAPGTSSTRLPPTRNPSHRNWPSPRAQFEIPVGDNGSAWIDCQCNVVTVRRVARDCFHVGMSFTSFEEDGGALVDRYISEQLATDA